MAATAPALATPSRGAPGRVAEVHRQCREGLIVAGGFVLAAAVAGVTGLGTGWWLPLHLFVVGGLLSAVSATAQMLAVTWSAAPAPSRRLAAVQRWGLAAGTVLLVTGRETGRAPLLAAGGATVVAATVALAVILVGVHRRAVTPRFRPAIEAYVAAVAAGATGMTIGIVLGVGHGGARSGHLRDVHLVLNVFGLIGLVVAATLPFFAATQVRAKMSPRATPTTLRVTFAGLVAATATAALGQLADVHGAVAAGLTVYALGLVAIAAMLPIYSPARLRWAGPRLVQLAAGLGWWAAMTVTLAVSEYRPIDSPPVLQALVLGGFAQVLVASLAYLGPVLRGGGHRRLTAGFALTRSWTSLAAGNAAAVAALVERPRLLAAVIVVWLADVGVRGVRLALLPRSVEHV